MLFARIIGIFVFVVILALNSNLLAQEGSNEETRVSEAAVATGVENLVPIGISETFPATVGTLYAFTKIQGSEGETQVLHRWIHGGKVRAEIPLSVRSKNWRTFSSKVILPEWTGDWKIEILTEDGTLLFSLPFMVE